MSARFTTGTSVPVVFRVRTNHNRKEPIMGKFVKNLEGVVHSVVDAFKLPRGWEEVSEAEASPALLGHDDDAAVTAVALHDNARKPVADSPSVGTIGHVDTRDLDIHPPVEPAPAANADTGAAAQSTDTTPGVSA